MQYYFPISLNDDNNVVVCEAQCVVDVAIHNVNLDDDPLVY